METKPRKVMAYEFKYDSSKDDWVKTDVGTGYFLGFGIDSSEDTHASFSTAIIEMPDGTVMNQALSLIRFIND